jgi:hypothetical protein
MIDVHRKPERMLLPEALAALRSYTSLSRPVQGVLEASDRGYETTRLLTVGDGLERVLRMGFGDEVLCVSALWATAGLGAERVRVQGPFAVRGVVYRPTSDKQRALVLGRVMRGSLAEVVPLSQNQLLLAEFEEGDRVTCTDTAQPMPFGVCVANGPLVPLHEYLSPVLEAKLSRLLVVAANGIYSVRALDGPPTSDTKVKVDAAALLKNLAELNLVITISDRPTTIHRLAGNCIVVAGDEADEEISRMRSALKISSKAELGLLPAVPTNAPPTFRVSRTLLMLDLPQVTREDVLAISNTQVVRCERQSLSDWHVSGVRLRVDIKLLRPANLETGSPSSTKLEGSLRMHGGDVDVSFSVMHEAFRATKPGELMTKLDEQLRNLTSDAIRAQLQRHERGPSTQTEIDAINFALAQRLQETANGSDLFTESIACKVVMTRSTESGEECKLPSGRRVFVPDFACTASARMIAYLAPLCAVGLGINFYPWRAVAADGVLL